MPHNVPSEGVYAFQGGALLAPASFSESRLQEPIPRGALEKDFAGVDVFRVPRVEGHTGEGEGYIGAVDIPAALPLPPDWKAYPMRQALSLMTTGIADGFGPIGRILRAFHIVQWRRDSAFCGSCGSRNGDAPTDLARLCPSCGRLEFPRISPAVITIIINDRGEALLAHNKKFSSGIYSLIAGFNEAGESLESTVVREIREEVGLEVKEVRYIASQPWPFPNSLMLGFTARHAGGAIRPDGIEIEDAQWFRRDALPGLPGGGSVSRHLINRWLEGTL